MGYNNEEEKKRAESIAEKTEHAHNFLGDKEMLNTLIKNVDIILPGIIKLREKEKHEPLTTEKQELLTTLESTLAQLKQAISDAKLLLGNNFLAQTTSYFYELKRLAEEGNEDARESYEKLLPSFKKMLEQGIDKPLGLN